MSPIQIAGLMPGCEFVRLGACEESEFEQFGDQVRKGTRAGGTQVIVKPSEGWEFKYDVRTNHYRPVQLFPVPREFTVVLKLESGDDLAALDTISHMPITVSVTETTPKPPEPATT
jgi:hypothetical protein